MANPQSGLRKRQQITKANRMMFVWVAGASVVIGICVVVAVFLGQKLFFNEKVLAEKQATVSTLRNNNDAVKELEENVRVLNTDQGLMDARANSDERPLQVVLDALPAERNEAALGSSIQERLLKGVSGVNLDSITIDEGDSEDDEVIDESADDDETGNRIGFDMTVTGSATNLKKVLENIEKSIRAIDVTTVTIESDKQLRLKINGHAYFEPAISIDLKEKVVKP